VTAGLVRAGIWFSILVALLVAGLGLLSDVPYWLVFARAYGCLLAMALILWVACRALAGSQTVAQVGRLDVVVGKQDGAQGKAR
jgi:hypothetical protein